MKSLSEGYSLKLFSLLGAATIGFAWWFPGSWMSFVLTWVAAFSFVVVARSSSSLKHLYLTGLIVQCLGFYWLFGTIHRFGNFPVLAALAIFSLFAVGSAVQFVLFGVFYRYLPKQLDHFALRGALAWVTVELASIRIFPWHLGHTLVSFTELVQIADVVGSLGLSFLVMWIVEALLLFKIYRTGAFLSVATLLGTIGYGHLVVSDFRTTPPAETFQTVLAQGNIPLYAANEKADPDEDILKHFRLSSPYDTDNTLIIWPETAVMRWTYTGLNNQSQEPRLPIFQEATLLTGSLMYQTRERLYNSAYTISPDGTLGAPYHKRVLMPYGEYTPFGETFPWMKEINSTAGEFIRGTGPDLHTVKLSGLKDPLLVSTLICYEDVVQGLAAEAVRAGAQVLVNLTNDAWFGDSLAPHQHHLIASFRAIENKRYHLRATNTGKTAVVNPLGKTLKSLPTYRTDALTAKISPLKEVTVFSRFENKPWWIMALIVCILSLVGIRSNQRSFL